MGDGLLSLVQTKCVCPKSRAIRLSLLDRPFYVCCFAGDVDLQVTQFRADWLALSRFTRTAVARL